MSFLCLGTWPRLCAKSKREHFHSASRYLIKRWVVMKIIHILTSCSVCLLYFNWLCETLTILKIDRKVFAVNVCVPNVESCCIVVLSGDLLGTKSKLCMCTLGNSSRFWACALWFFSTFKSGELSISSECQAQRLRQNSGSQVIFNPMMRDTLEVKHFLIDLHYLQKSCCWPKNITRGAQWHLGVDGIINIDFVLICFVHSMPNF